MNDTALIIMIITMAIVTYVPRMLPLVVLHRLRLPPFLRRQLRFIPYAALGALIFPGVLYSTDRPATAVIGACTALALALLKANLLLVVVGSIAAVYFAGLLL
ncbi:AzlD domain-containing protein [Paenibacillus thermotolerans]|uniref:AzlD domain-containing protein n=1 Tax=Paenibacillus thermotolerans TaxID=3027807 RepID=UPI002368B520|nr:MULTISPECIES: AzlD domain-containing protein [unclassified Paenibacillus]